MRFNRENERTPSANRSTRRTAAAAVGRRRDDIMASSGRQHGTGSAIRATTPRQRSHVAVIFRYPFNTDLSRSMTHSREAFLVWDGFTSRGSFCAHHLRLG
ncbi:hypothetical protein Y032_0071g559 [Ancylostoma ceylanicum]|uniref:Uncharacterized protein n=1 Tax=Ancylostoma ceylanicum TaxID=53326 RepID=A0A016TY32_9BILA|nr:hypothetical protein Y032_0071g559 [Ancylostoma ceylanicum]